MTQVNSAASTAAVNASQAGRTYQSQKAGNSFDQDAFLKILVAQLSSQDPLNPLDQNEFIAQMAQFTQVEQTLKLNENLQTLGNTLRFSTSMLVGAHVQYITDSGQASTGTIQAILFEKDSVRARMADGTECPLDAISLVS